MQVNMHMSPALWDRLTEHAVKWHKGKRAPAAMALVEEALDARDKGVSVDSLPGGGEIRVGGVLVEVRVRRP